MKRFLFFISLIVFSMSCEPDVKFSKALPPEIDIIEEVPIIFHGTYMCQSDSSRVFINKKNIVLESHHIFKTSLKDVEETEDCSIVAGGLYLPGRKECIPFEYIAEDSISAKIYELDTMIAFESEREAVKYYKGHLFINLMNDENHWSTWLLSPESDGSILFRMIDIPNEKDKIEEISLDYETIEIDTQKVNYILNPTLVEFNRILEKKYLTECDQLIPVNLEIKIFRN